MREIHRASLAALTLLLAVQPAWAQENQAAGETEATDTAAPTIVVTGFRRLDTPLQDEAVASSSLDEDVFRYSGSTDRIDVLRTVPGLTVLNLGGRSTIVIRGASTAPDGDPNGAAAASYIGEVALSGLSGSRENVDLSNYDIERIDVLRGPQGFSFGGGAMSGVVRTVPNAADTSGFSARVAAAGRVISHGDNPGYEIDGFVNVPLIDNTLALRVTGYANREENPIYSTFYGRQGSPATVRGGRLSLRYEPTDALTIDLRYVHEQRELMDLTRIDPALGEYATGERRELNRKKTHIAWLEADWDLGFATATYVGSYLTSAGDSSYPVYWALGTGGESIDSLTDTKAKAVTQEARIGDSDRHGFDWTVGVYYEWRKTDNDSFYALAETNTPVSSEFDFDDIDDPDAINYLGGFYALEEEQKSLFAEVAYWIDDEVGITLGGRVLDHRATSAYLDTIEGEGAQQPTFIDTFPDTTGWWKKLNITWTPTGDQLYYAQVAQVERPGGTNYDALDPSCPAEYAERVQEYYPGDTMTTWEAGAKLGLGRGTTVNASGYYSRWKNAPTYTGALCANGINYYIDSAGATELYGVEVDAQMRLTRALSASMSAAYGIARITEISPSFTGAVVGDRTPGNPDWKVSGNLDYRDALTDDLDIFAGTGFSYTGHYLNGLSVDWSTYAAFATFPGLDVDVIGQFPSGVDQYSDPGSGGYVLFDARIGVSDADWTATLFVDNLFNSHSRVLVNYLNITEAGNATYTYVTPRTFGVRVERRF